MATDLSLRLVFATDGDGERMAGRLCDERGEEHHFSSWVGLLSLLDAARERARPAAAANDGERERPS